MQVSSLPTSHSGATPAAPARRGGAAEDALASGLAAVAEARTVGEVERRAGLLAARLPHVGGVASFRRDDRGLFVQTFTVPGAPLAPDLAARAMVVLHQRWIAAHGPAVPEHGFIPYADDERPDLVIAPFVQGDLLIGGLALAGVDGRSPLSTAVERVALASLAVVATQAMVTLELRRRVEQSVSRGDHEATLTETRKQLSRELHDGPAQDLALAGLTLDRLVTTLGADQPISADARQARDLIDRAILDMRKTIGRLRVTRTAAPSITGPLRQLLAEMAPGAPGLEVNFGDVSGVRLAPEVERAVIGIVREALHNVRKHANADSVRLEVRREPEGMEVAVIDDGVGFDGSAPPGHFGLDQIRELAEETGGRLEVGSKAGNGTVVRAWIPIKGQEP